MSKFTEIELKVSETIELYKGLEAVKKHKGSRFAILVARNMKTLHRTLVKYENLAKPSEEFMKVSALANKYAEAEDTEAIEKLEADNSNLIEERKLQLSKLEEAMEELVTLELELIKENQLPEEITGEEIVPILPILV